MERSETIDEMAKRVAPNCAPPGITQWVRQGILAGLEAAAKVADPDEYMSVRDTETAEQIADAIRKLKGE